MDGAEGMQGGKAHCVVWRPRGLPLPAALVNALSRPDYAVTECDNQFEAVGQLCRGRAAGVQTVLLVVEPRLLPAIADAGDVIDCYAPATTWWMFEQLPTPQIRAVLPSDRAAWDTPAPLSNAVGAEVQAPPPPAPPLIPVIRPSVRAIAEDAVATSKVKLSAPPRLRLAGDGPEIRSAATPAPEVKIRPAEPHRAPEAGIRPGEGPEIQPVQSGKPENLLSDEELAMLLAPEPRKGNY